MCGIGGIVRFDGAPVDRGRLEAMSRQLRHRGPDEAATWVEGPVGLVHRRLSIIDLAGSHQPMRSADGRLTLAFNGEVLNYRSLRERWPYPYTTHGDTETILAGHSREGGGAVRHLAGQFAYAVHDAHDGSVTLVRDRLGILPLFWWRDEGSLVFASELPALVAGIGRVPELAEDALGEYLRDRYVSAPRTLLRGVHKVLPGTTLTVAADGTRREARYWSAPQVTWEGRSDEQAVDQLDRLLGHALDNALVADVPVGAYLSGGVDSSLIVAKARAAGADRLHTYCADFGDPRFDETTHAEVVSRHVGTRHRAVPVTPATFVDSWAELSLRRGAPLSEPADVALYQLALAARQDVKVVLSGEGSDELFGGYPKYRFARATAWAGALPAGVRGPALRRLARSLPAGRRRLAIAVRAMSEDGFEDRSAAWFAAFSGAEVHELVGELPHRGPSPDRRTPLRRMMHHDLHRWLSDSLLERGDRMSMAASLELRPPFLDHDVVDFSLGLPDRFLVREGTTKWLVKEVARRHLPAQIIDRPKIGFRVPLDAWFKGDLQAFVNDTVTASGSVVTTHLSRPAVRRLLDDHASGRQDNAVKIWTLASLNTWHDQLGRALEGDGPPSH